MTLHMLNLYSNMLQFKSKRQRTLFLHIPPSYPRQVFSTGVRMFDNEVLMCLFLVFVHL